MIQVEHLTKDYGQRRAIDHLTFQRERKAKFWAFSVQMAPVKLPPCEF